MALVFVGAARFELTTSCSQSRRDTGLRYAPKDLFPYSDRRPSRRRGGTRYRATLRPEKPFPIFGSPTFPPPRREAIPGYATPPKRVAKKAICSMQPTIIKFSVRPLVRILVVRLRHFRPFQSIPKAILPDFPASFTEDRATYRRQATITSVMGKMPRTTEKEAAQPMD